MTIQFEAGKTYQTRSICDWDCIYTIEVLSRTAKRVQIKAHGDVVMRGITVVDGVEQFKPFGNHSMCAIIRANKERA